MKQFSLPLMMCGTILALLLAACTRQPGSFGLDPDRVAQLDGILSRMAAAETFSGSVLIAQDGEVLLSRGYGSADREQGISNTPQTRFLIGSVTKQFTAMAILILQSRAGLTSRIPSADTSRTALRPGKTSPSTTC